MKPMTEREFADKLRSGLSGMPEKERDERILFYMESIHDRIEEGMSEDDAIAALGPTDKIIEQILKDTPLKTLVKEKVSKRREMHGWEIALIIIGAPVWIPLLVAALACAFAFFTSLFSVILALFVCFAAIVVSGVVTLGCGIFALCCGSFAGGGFLIGIGLIGAGVSILLFVISILAVKAVKWLIKFCTLGVKRLFVGKEKEA